VPLWRFGVSNWIRFHAEIREGKHRGIPRALRFVFLELCLLARPGRGTIDLPLKMDLVDGVHDLLGGSRREVAATLDLLTPGPDPGSPTLVIEGKPGALRLVIPSWRRWNPIDESAERTRRYRENRALSAGCDASQPVTGPSHPVTAVTPLDQRRGDQRRSDPPVGPPAGGTPAGQDGIPGMVREPPASGKSRRKARQDMGRRPPSWVPNDGHFKLGTEAGLSRAEVLSEVGPWTDHHVAAGTLIADFDGSFRTWIRRVPEFRRNRPTDARPGLGTFRREGAEGVPKPKAREPTRSEVQRMLDEAERDTSTMSPAVPEPSGSR
jgi:hypothetical protein